MKLSESLWWIHVNSKQSVPWNSWNTAVPWRIWKLESSKCSISYNNNINLKVVCFIHFMESQQYSLSHEVHGNSSAAQTVPWNSWKYISSTVCLHQQNSQSHGFHWNTSAAQSVHISSTVCPMKFMEIHQQLSLSTSAAQSVYISRTVCHMDFIEIHQQHHLSTSAAQSVHMEFMEIHQQHSLSTSAAQSGPWNSWKYNSSMKSMETQQQQVFQ